jgi:hypothetical protein
MVDCFLRARCRRCWGLLAERLEKTEGQRSKRWGKCSGGTSAPGVAVEMVCRQLRALHGNDKVKISEGLNNSKNMVFNVKKLWKSCKTMAWTWCYGKGTEKSDPSGMSGRYCGFRSPMVRYCRQTCQRQWLPWGFEMACIRLGQEDVSWWKIRLSTDLAPIHNVKTPSGSLRNSRLWLPYLPYFNSLDFSI